MLSEQDLRLAKATYTFWDKLTPEQVDFLCENLYPVSYKKAILSTTVNTAASALC
ncbi:MAG: hypothetical protein V8Q30_05490 [Acutalibacteraceae bacterium]